MRKPDTSVYVEPSVRTFADWSPDTIRSALVLAENGNLRLMADLCDHIMADDTAGAKLDDRAGLFRLPLAFEPAKGAARRTPVIKASEDDWTLANPEAELKLLLRWGVLAGLGVAQIIWSESTDSGRVLPRLKVWHLRHIRWDQLHRTYYARQENGTEVPVEHGSGKWVIYTPYGESRPWSLGKWRAIALWFCLKRYAIEDWALYSEVHGQPIRQGVTVGGPNAPTPTDAQRRQLAQDLSDLGRDTGFVPPPGMKLELVEATANTYATFQSQINMANEATAIAIVGQNLTTKVDGGSFAAAGVHLRVEQGLIEGDGATLSTTLREQSWAWWAEYNFGSRALTPWPKWDTTPPEDKKADADRLNILGEALTKLEQLGVDVDPVLQRHGLTRREDYRPPDPAAPAPAPDVTTSSRPTRLNVTPSKAPTGIIACLVPSNATASALALDGGEPASELHVTLAFFGTVDTVDPQTLERLVDEMRACAENHDDPINATIGGIGRFSLPERDAFHATVDAPALLAFREEIVARAANAGLTASTAHGFTPHITLAYLDATTPNPLQRLTPIRESFTELQVWAGERRWAFTIGSSQHRGPLTLTARPRVTLASGDPPERTPGLIEGQLYVDAVGDVLSAAGRAVFGAYTDEILAGIQAGESYADLRERLTRLYANATPDELSELLYRAMLLSELAGRYAVLQDVAAADA